MTPRYFGDQTEFRQWLTENHEKESELLVGFYKVGSGRPSMTWPQSVDQALCFGWIDGVRRRVDKDSYSIRFTPRRPNSTWSAVNIKKVAELTEKGLMRPAGIEAFARRKDHRSEIYGYENAPKTFSPEIEARFRENVRAWEFFTKQPGGYQRTMTNWVMGARKDETKVSRLEKLITESESGRRFG